MRLFIAVKPGGETGSALAALQDRLRARAASGRFPRREDLHLTLAFLGETPESQLPLLGGIIRDSALAAGQAPLLLNLRRLGCFRHGGKELWWIGPAGEDPGLPPLLALREHLAAALDQAGAGYDRRPFRAHITLGRDIRGIPPDWAGKPEAGLAPGGILFPLGRLSLMKSEYSGKFRVYTELSGAALPPAFSPAPPR
jgi:2'-5' RNA ligase